MAAVQSFQPSTVSSPSQSPPPMSSLPPLVTSALRRPSLARTSSSAKDRLSIHASMAQIPSRPISHVFPLFHTSLSYALVRDFAYPVDHPLHYGPPLEPSTSVSASSTPDRRLSDPPRASWDTSIGGWSAGPWGGDGALSREPPPSIMFQDGPPWREDDDIQSPVVSSSRHKKHKSTSGAFAGSRGRGRGIGDTPLGEDEVADLLTPRNYDPERGYFAGVRADGSEVYFVRAGTEDSTSSDGEFVTYPPDQARRPRLAPYNVPGQRDSHFAATLPNRSYADQPRGATTDRQASPRSPSSPDLSPGAEGDEKSRYSRDYQFTIASPDEEMHGKAVALFDFARENENELPLVEGQVIWVSYRHGQGWLVAEDPKTRENGLVPEEYVRLLRDIRGGWGSLTSDISDASISASASANSGSTPLSPQSDFASTPTQSSEFFQRAPLANGSGSGAAAESHGPKTPQSQQQSQQQQQQQQQQHQHHPPIVSTFSTSSKDLDRVPVHLLSPLQSSGSDDQKPDS